MKAILVGGTGRSGTTILKRVLAQHSRVASMPFEVRLIVDPGGALDLVNALSDSWSPYNADIAIQRFRQLALDCAHTSILVRGLAKGLTTLGVAPWRYAAVGIGEVVGQRYYHQRVDELVQALTWHVSRGNWAGSPPFRFPSRMYETVPRTREAVAALVGKFIEDLFIAIPRFNAATSKPGATHWIEDTPYNILHARELLELFPDMRLLHIYRDPRDVIASYRERAWGGDNVTVCARRVAGVLERWSVVREQLPQTCYMEIALEELSAKPQEHLHRICDFVGLSYEPGLESVSLNRVNAGRWQRELSVDEQKVAQQILEACDATRASLTASLNP